jgi:predicted membrane protein (TIGR00267 family)
MAKEQREVEEVPDVETEEVREIFRDKGIHGELLERVTQEITSDKKVWVDVMMRDELHLTPVSDKGLVRRALVTGFSTLIGSLIPLIPFLFVPLFGISITAATLMAVPLCAAVLFGVGAYKAITLVGDWRMSGLQMTIIGMVSAAAGYGIGRLLHVSGP